MDRFNHLEEHIDEGMVMIQANLDDMNPEMTSYVMDLLFEAGANDVFWVPIVMKKGRPGMMLNVFAHRDRLAELKEIIFRETTTLGIRYSAWTCHRLGREKVDVNTPWGTVTVKVGIFEGEAVQYAPEYEDCRRISEKADIPLKKVYDEVRFRYSVMRESRNNQL
ncbi:nickel insertion protein [Marinicrinis lubricantis]|uniref:Nickel insertion protein n=1 Tax=Marinicrinis lubricantis TaxID=2086470 RepID=A0ABW1IPG3_9BACL